METEPLSTVSRVELNANDVTPPPPGTHPLVSVPPGVPTMPVKNGVHCTGARYR